MKLNALEKSSKKHEHQKIESYCKQYIIYNYINTICVEKIHYIDLLMLI